MVHRSVRNPARVQLRELRLKAGIEQYELAAVMGIDTTEVSRFETGQRDAMPRGLGLTDYLAALERVRTADWNQIAFALGVTVREVHLVRRRRRQDYIEALRRLTATTEPAA